MLLDPDQLIIRTNNDGRMGGGEGGCWGLRICLAPNKSFGVGQLLVDLLDIEWLFGH